MSFLGDFIKKHFLYIFFNALKPSASSPAMTVEHSFSYYMRQNLLSKVLECAVVPDIWTAGEKKKKKKKFCVLCIFIFF